MGYNISFDGLFRLDRPLKREHKAILDELASEEHTPGEEGKPLREARSGRPCIYCQWKLTDDGLFIAWDLGGRGREPGAFMG